MARRSLRTWAKSTWRTAQTLLDFIEWAVTNFPARKRMLILSDHGIGWPGGWSDPDPGGPGAHDIFLADGFGDNLWLMELDRDAGARRVATWGWTIST